MGIKESAIKQFGRRADAYSKGNIFVDGVHLSEVVRRSGVAKNHRVLDIATGAGFMALEFAKHAGMVTGCDITRNMLAHAREKQEKSGILNIDFLQSDVELLPFPDGMFDIVSCRFAFHHFPDPMKALYEIKRVCKNKIVIVDGVSSEDRNKSLFHNSIEKMRDPSHVRIYQLSEMRNMFNSLGAGITDIAHRDIPQDFDEWMGRAGTGKKETKIIRELMLQRKDDGTGLRVNIKDGRLGFIYDTVILIAEVSAGI